MDGLKVVLLLLICIDVLTEAQYDDSDYDYDFYEDLQFYNPKLSQPVGRIKPEPAVQDDFYILNDFEETAHQNNAYPLTDEIELVLENDDGTVEVMKPPYQQLKWFKEPEKVYQYTKHRIPGYDYDELDFMGERRLNRCDARSVWSHCVCQFTCENRDEVDCYMPCISGCECKENFVFYEDGQRCIEPIHCPENTGVHIYKK